MAFNIYSNCNKYYFSVYNISTKQTFINDLNGACQDGRKALSLGIDANDASYIIKTACN